MNISELFYSDDLLFGILRLLYLSEITYEPVKDNKMEIS